MTSLQSPQRFDRDMTKGKPRIAIMGEFSSGKSTLTNLLLGANPLPTKVTATQLPPVWISYGDKPSFYENHSGKKFPFEINSISEISLDETIVVRLFMQSDILTLCDLIDMPGISDPNMSSDVWAQLIDEADCVIWCTPANQSWRQSEAAVWAALPKELHSKSLLLVTHSDKLRSKEDLDKVLKRVRGETENLFAGVHPISVRQALAAREDQDAWEDSGADAFVNQFVDILSNPADCVFSRVSQQARQISEIAPETDAGDSLIPERNAPAFTVIKSKPRTKTPRPPRQELPQTFQDTFFVADTSAHKVPRN